MEDHKGALKIEYDDNSTKTIFFSTRFGLTFGTLKFKEKTFFFNPILGFTPCWDFKPTIAIHADSRGV